MERYNNFMRAHPRISLGVTVGGSLLTIIGLAGLPSDLESWGATFNAIGGTIGRWLLVIVGLTAIALTSSHTNRRIRVGVLVVAFVLTLAIIIVGLLGKHSGLAPIQATIRAEFVPLNAAGKDPLRFTQGAARGGECRRSFRDATHLKTFACYFQGISRDPCVKAPPFVGLVCYFGPWPNSDGSMSVQEVIPAKINTQKKLSHALQKKWEFPWGLELRNGLRCIRVRQTIRLPTGVQYECGDSQDERAGFVLHAPNRSRPAWTVAFVPYENSTAEATREYVVRAWE